MKIFFTMLCGCSLFFAQKLFFIGAPLYKESLSYGPTKGAFKLLLDSTLDVPPAGVSIFVLGLGIICLLAYFRSLEKTDKAAIIYFATAPMLLLFMFTRYEAYRPIYLVPLLYLLMSVKPKLNRTNLLLEIAATGSLSYFYLLDDNLFFHSRFLLSPTGTREVSAFCEKISSRIPGFGFQITTAVFVLSMGMLLVVNHPDFEAKSNVLTREEEPWLIYLRTGINVLPLVLSLVMFL